MGVAVSGVAPVPAPRRKALPARMLFLLAFHALVSGAFIIAWLSGDEDTYRIHLVAGYAALTAVAVRVAVGWAGWLQAPRPVARPRWLDWQAQTLLSVIALTGVTGVAADFWSLFEDLHEVVANVALWAVLAHVAIILGRAARRRIR